MKQTTSFLALLLFVFFGVKAQTNDIYFTSFPSISPDAKTVVFCYEGDVWKTDLATKIATRLTAMTGNESRPRISPDGK